jgi:hypothetical protein
MRSLSLSSLIQRLSSSLAAELETKSALQAQVRDLLEDRDRIKDAMIILQKEHRDVVEKQALPGKGGRGHAHKKSLIEMTKEIDTFVFSFCLK